MSASTARKFVGDAVTTYQNLIGGKWQPAADGRTVDMVSPSDGQTFAKIARGSKADIDAAVAAARHAFEEGAWSKLAAVERGRLMTKLGEAILANHEELSQLEARDCGKPMKQARADITAAARYFEFYGGAADKYHGETIPFLDGYMVTILREPKGVTGHIIPWNYPAQMFGRSLAPALAMGNAVVMKPAEDACVAPRQDGATCAGSRLSARRFECRHRHWRRSRRCAGRPSRHRFPVVYRLAGSRHAGAEGGGREPYRLHAGTGRQVAADRLRGR